MHFGDQAAREAGAMRKQISDQALALMLAHSWPGNIRELRNFIERVYILTPSDFVDAHDVRFAGLGLDGAAEGMQMHSELSTFREARARFEKEYIQKKIAENNGNISRTAEVIGLERSYLHRKIKAFGISAEEIN
jgi:two-component system nitrogen regulation response regulator NtrX